MFIWEKNSRALLEVYNAERQLISVEHIYNVNLMSSLIFYMEQIVFYSCVDRDLAEKQFNILLTGSEVILVYL